MIIIWLIAGIIVVTIAYFIPGQDVDIWTNLNYAGIAAVIYVFILVVFTLRKPFSKKTITITWLIFIIAVLVVYLHWTEMNAQTHWQKNKLLELRAIISRGVIQEKIQEILHRVLLSYHQQNSKDKKTIGDIFKEIYSTDSIGTNIYTPYYEGDSLRIYLTQLSDSEVVIVSQEMFVKGRNPEFRNYNGRLGMIQDRATLTAKGVRYESEN